MPRPSTDGSLLIFLHHGGVIHVGWSSLYQTAYRQPMVAMQFLLCLHAAARRRRVIDMRSLIPRAALLSLVFAAVPMRGAGPLFCDRLAKASPLLGLLASGFCAGLRRGVSRQACMVSAVSCAWGLFQLTRLPGFPNAFLLAGWLLSSRGSERGSERCRVDLSSTLLVGKKQCW